MGFAYGGRYRKRVKSLIDLHQAVRLLETEVIVFANPLPIAIKNISNRITDEIFNAFKIIEKDMHSNDGGDLYNSFLKTTDFLRSSCCLKPEDINVFLSLGKSIGKTNREDQQQHFKFIISEISQLIIEAKEDKNKNEKMYRFLGILMGLGMIIILI
jgi:stage III sporulation protein AB